MTEGDADCHFLWDWVSEWATESERNSGERVPSLFALLPLPCVHEVITLMLTLFSVQLLLHLVKLVIIYLATAGQKWIKIYSSIFHVYIWRHFRHVTTARSVHRSFTVYPLGVNNAWSLSSVQYRRRVSEFIRRLFVSRLCLRNSIMHLLTQSITDIFVIHSVVPSQTSYFCRYL